LASGKDRAFYAAPGGDDEFLRPPSGHAYAPREIGIASRHGATVMSWVHRRDGREELVAVEGRAKGRGRLQAVEADSAPASCPALVFNGDNSPIILAAVHDGPSLRLRAWARCGKSWSLLADAPTKASAIHRIDAILCPDGTITVAYSGVLKGHPGLMVFVRSLRGARWSRETRHPLDHASLNRPRLAANQKGELLLVADACQDERFDIVWKWLSPGKGSAWQAITKGRDWDMFPSIVRDADDRFWLSWLHQSSVSRDNVMGLHQEARMARLDGGKWQPIRDGNSLAAADMNLGLLPIKRYFGYDGLRRYPRLLAADDGAVWLMWEQQKDEEEVWENLNNGLLLGRKYAKGKWSKAKVLMDSGSCFAWDSSRPQPATRLPVAVKASHVPSGNDFAIAEIDLEIGRVYKGRPKRLWKGWTPQRLPAKPGDNNRIVVTSQEGMKLNLFWGDLHCHSILSPDAEGEPDELFAFARDCAKIDFACLADNDFYPSRVILDSEVRTAAGIAAAMTAPDFLALTGYEWTFHQPDAGRTFNHRIIVFPPGQRRIARRTEADGRSQRAFANYLAETGYFNFPHHAHWKLLGAEGEWGVEVTAAWGTYILDSDTVFRALNAGKRFAFLGNSDSHRFMPGLSGALTGVYAGELSYPSITDAIHRRRTFATTGQKTAVALWVDDAFMGDEVILDKPPRIRWRVSPHGKLESVTIIRDGKRIHTSSKMRGSWVDADYSVGHHWYLIEVKEHGTPVRHPHNVAPAWGQYAWTSPVWVSDK
jgi:Protein of unknown function (DUF3604)